MTVLPPVKTLRIAVIHEAKETAAGIHRYGIAAFGELWRKSGHSVIHLFGPHEYVPADIALLHVDLSVLPRDYLSLAGRYPVALNSRITDIRKSSFSRIRVGSAMDYSGPVIVKTDLNRAGIPERRAFGSKRTWRSFREKLRGRVPFPEKLEYPVYASADEVPRHYWKDPSLIVEKFLPESRDGFYFLRHSYFLGERHCSWMLRSPQPVIRVTSCLDDEVEISTPEEIKVFRRRIGLDYGKIDFVEHEGEIIILDVNKTIGGSPMPVTTSLLASAIESFTGF